MAKSKFCCYIVRDGPLDTSSMCGRPAHRVSEGRHYCREHFEAVIDGAKTAVVDAAAKFYALDDGEQRLMSAVDHLRSLGWTMGD